MPRSPKLSWQMISKILEFAAVLGKDNLAAIQRSMDTWVNGLPVEERPMETAPDTRTIRRVIEVDLNKMSPEAVIERLPRSVWSLRKDYDEIKELAGHSNTSPEANQDSSHYTKETPSKDFLFDKQLFAASNEIMNERDLRSLLFSVELHRSYRLSEYIKVAKFWEFFGLEGNKYNDPETRRLLDNLWDVLDELVLFLKLEFREEKVKGESDPECRLDPGGLRYIDDDIAKAKRITEAEKRLYELIDTVRGVYKVYRACIRNSLFV